MLIHDPAQHYTKDLRRPQPTLQYQLAATTAGYLVFVIAINLILFIYLKYSSRQSNLFLLQ